MNPPSRSAPERRTHPPVVLRSTFAARGPPPIGSRRRRSASRRHHLTDRERGRRGGRRRVEHVHAPRNDAAKAKSSSRVPSAASAWARMPADDGHRGPRGRSRAAAVARPAAADAATATGASSLGAGPPVASAAGVAAPGRAASAPRSPSVDPALVGLAAERRARRSGPTCTAAVDHAGHVRPRGTATGGREPGTPGSRTSDRADGRELVVLAPERHDRDGTPVADGPGEASQPVAVEPGAVHEPASAEPAVDRHPARPRPRPSSDRRHDPPPRRFAAHRPRRSGRRRVPGRPRRSR